MFGFSSTLIPAGYNNDEYFYQCPNQDLWSNNAQDHDSSKDRANNSIGPSMLNSTSPNQLPIHSREHHYLEEIQITQASNAIETNRTGSKSAIIDQQNVTPKMKSGRFLVIHTVASTLILSGCAIYISVTKDNLSVASSNALILPQILAVVPGCFFTLSRSVLYLINNRPKIFPKKAWKVLLIIFSAVLAIIAYGSVIPAMFWSLLWKVSGAAFDLIQEIDDAT